MILQHGTTKQWAEEILQNGPNPYFKVPHDPETHPRGFFCAVSDRPFLVGSPEQFARSTAANFPETGPPAILEFVIPDESWPEFVGRLGEEEEGKGIDREIEIWFGIDFVEGIDFGTKKLLDAWPRLEKRIIPLKGT